MRGRLSRVATGKTRASERFCGLLRKTLGWPVIAGTMLGKRLLMKNLLFVVQNGTSTTFFLLLGLFDVPF